MKNETRADKKFHRVLREYYRNELRSSSGEPIKNRERAIAIAFAEARRIDPKYHITKHANGTKIKIDNTLQIVFEDAWQHYLNYIASTRENTKPLSFEQWLRTTPDGLKYNKRMAQLIRYNEIIVEPQMNERGTKISNNDEHRGGKIRGHLHRNGGVKSIIVDTNKPVELELDELIITKGVARADDDVVCTGKPEGIASRLNEKYGGDKISNKNATCHLKKEIMERGKKIFKTEYQVNIYEKNGNLRDSPIFDSEEGAKFHAKEYKEKLGYNTEIIPIKTEIKSRKKIFGIFERGTKIKQFIGIDDTSKIKRQIEREQQLKNNEMEQTQKLEHNMEYIKINEPKNFKIVEHFHAEPRMFSEMKLICYDDLLIYKSTNEMQAFLDKYGIHYSVFDNYEELSEWLIKQLPSRIQNKLK